MPNNNFATQLEAIASNLEKVASELEAQEQRNEERLQKKASFTSYTGIGEIDTSPHNTANPLLDFIMK